jgi:hypothetical protein
MSKLKKKLTELFGIDIRSLALFRIGLALVLIGDLIIRLQDLKAHYSDEGVLPRIPLIDGFLDPWSLSLHLISGQWQIMLILFLLQIVFAIAFLVGYHTRLATILSWFFLFSLHLRNTMILQGGDIVLKLLFFWAMFLPLGACWSLDQKLKKQPSPSHQIVSAGTVALLLQICFIYWFSALLKTDPSWRTDGTAVWYALSIEQYATPLGHQLLHYPNLLKVLTFATFYLEAFGPFFAFSPIWTAPLRMATVVIFMLFHLIGLNLTMTLALFPYICAVAWMAFIPGWFWNHVLKQPKQIIPTIPWKASWLSNGLATFFIIYIFFWNVSTLGISWPPFSPPPLIISSLFGVDQTWDMFAPTPLREDGWYVMPGLLKDGTEINVFTNGGPVDWKKPALLSAVYPNDRWRSYLMNLVIEEEGEMHIPLYANYLCRQWNSTHSSDKKLLSFDIYFMGRENSLETPSAPYQRMLLWHQECSEWQPDF